MAKSNTAMRVENLIQRGFDQSYIIRGGLIKVKCSQCEAAVINGIAAHETGCPHTPVACPECGQMYPNRQAAAECCALVDDDADQPFNLDDEPEGDE